MKPTRKLGYLPLSGLLPAILLLVFSLNCSSHARATAVRTSEAAVPAEEYEADEFIGVPIVGDYDEDLDLDFILEVRDGEQTFKIEVHEDVNDSNREVIDRIRSRINELEDLQQLRVIGYYNSEYRGKSKEYGFMDLKCVVFFDEESGYEEAYFTDAKESRYYDNGNVTVVYAPGHHYSSVYYPRYTTPWWDTDGDGIPNRYDLWPLTYDVWYDYNLNGFPDWYDPYYCDYYPYWGYWNSGFWLSYNWYSPGYFRHGYMTHAYYDDYRTYTRLYDRRYVSASRKNYHLDPKTDYYRRAGRDNTVRESSLRAASRGTGYTSLPVDGRRLVSSGGESSLDPKSETLATRTDPEPISFSRNRAIADGASEERSGRTRADGVTGVNRESNATNASSTARVRGTDRTRASEGRTVERADRPLDRIRSTSDDRVYSPSSSDISAGGSSAASSGAVTGKTKTRSTESGRLTRPTTSRRTRTSTSYRGSDRSRTGGSYSRPAPSSRSRERIQSSPRPSASPSTPSRSRSQPAPAARSAPSSNRSSPAPRARSSSGSSGSRSSGSKAKSSSSSGGDRRRR